MLTMYKDCQRLLIANLRLHCSISPDHHNSSISRWVSLGHCNWHAPPPAILRHTINSAAILGYSGLNSYYNDRTSAWEQSAALHLSLIAVEQHTCTTNEKVLYSPDQSVRCWSIWLKTDASIPGMTIGIFEMEP